MWFETRVDTLFPLNSFDFQFGPKYRLQSTSSSYTWLAVQPHRRQSKELEYFMTESQIHLLVPLSGFSQETPLPTYKILKIEPSPNSTANTARNRGTNQMKAPGQNEALFQCCTSKRLNEGNCESLSSSTSIDLLIEWKDSSTRSMPNIPWIRKKGSSACQQSSMNGIVIAAKEHEATRKGMNQQRCQREKDLLATKKIVVICFVIFLRVSMRNLCL